MRGHAFGLTVLVLAISLLGAQEPQPTIQVRTADGRTTFQIGERIQLNLTFTNPEGNPYMVDRDPCGIRSCGLPETFEVQPATGWSDPLATYFAHDFPIRGDGHPSPLFGRKKPLQVSLDLNEWVRFDQPGDYTVKVASHRIAWGTEQPNLLASNIIDLHIIPATPEWQSGELEWIRENWGFEHAFFGAAQADLQYLATPAAVEEMTSRLREEVGPFNVVDECTPCMGIIGLSGTMRDMAIKSMNQRIQEPDFPISPVFLNTMFFLHIPPGSNTRMYLRPVQPYDTVLWLKVFAALPKKERAARAQTAQTLLEDGQYIDTPEVRRRMRELRRVSMPGSDPASK
jgi:hypothetical protein